MYQAAVQLAESRLPVDATPEERAEAIGAAMDWLFG